MADRKSLALVCEDTDLGRWALTRALEAEGYEVHATSTWAEASVWLLKGKFDLALVTVSSPSNAAEIVACISRHHPHTHLVLLADQDSIGELRLVCSPVPDILAKPFDLGRVAKVACSHLGSGSETLGA
jgi:DNA-binding NtrC family response regulator